MARKETLKRKPFIHISRRTDIDTKGKIIIKASSILGALLLCGLIATIITPGSFFSFYGYLVSGSFGPTVLFTLKEAALLLLISVAITPAFKMKFWNIGAEGQVLMGCLGAVIVMKFAAPYMPLFLALILMLIVAIIFGAAWAFIPGFFKALFNTNETLFTLMMNYVAAAIVAAFSYANKAPSDTAIGVINQDTRAGWLPNIFGQPYVLLIIICVVLVLGVWFFLKYSKKGYEIAVLNGSVKTAEYVGINVKLVTIRTMIMGGALCGVAGFLIASGGSWTVSDTIVGGKGFTAVMISWLGHFNPLEMGLYTMLYSVITIGSETASGELSLGGDIPAVMSGLFFLIILASEFFVNFRVKFNFHQNKKDNAPTVPPSEATAKGGE